MLGLNVTSQFRKDYKRMKKQGKDLSLLEGVIDLLLAEDKLPQKYRDHALSGKYAGFRECHIQSDWLLMYKLDTDRLILTAIRTGSHADLLNM